jgi:hypothetical protein
MPLLPLEKTNIEVQLNLTGNPIPGIFQHLKEQSKERKTKQCRNKLYKSMIFERLEQTLTIKETHMEE